MLLLFLVGWQQLCVAHQQQQPAPTLAPSFPPWIYNLRCVGGGIGGDAAAAGTCKGLLFVPSCWLSSGFVFQGRHNCSLFFTPFKTSASATAAASALAGSTSFYLIAISSRYGFKSFPFKRMNFLYYFVQFIFPFLLVVLGVQCVPVLVPVYVATLFCFTS